MFCVCVWNIPIHNCRVDTTFNECVGGRHVGWRVCVRHNIQIALGANKITNVVLTRHFIKVCVSGMFGSSCRLSDQWRYQRADNRFGMGASGNHLQAPLYKHPFTTDLFNATLCETSCYATFTFICRRHLIYCQYIRGGVWLSSGWGVEEMAEKCVSDTRYERYWLFVMF